ncbi:histidine utilization repressor [Rhizobium sp. LEGMi198b]|uniref:histidine utilization repressor n=1 Tax=unclassified Rhizobium TaxID=2613769 RepID=UPI000CDF3DD5|nr:MULTISPECIES: histidine utilization repressor [Rhizobium]AVA23440.1 histidine utilization repressor protein [Rhizobium sp. NXC24]MDK4739567.1 histidine utilization repressor [Rhizobium sp. CNPSo 3464]UWU20786.1 histidine utilization repressor [Rhizobium tropici]WFU01596.1 histidine utilization repressor [Rhizobium sp. CB3171]
MTTGKEATLHQRILNDIESRIVSGDWPPGHRIPFELALAEQYDCSRMTVNKALTQLARAGLIERRKRSGSFVTQPQAQSAVLEIHDIKSEILSLNLPYSHKIVKRAKRKGRPEDARRLQFAGAVSVLDITCIHYAGRRPFCLEDRVINLDAVPEAAQVDFDALPPGPWLINQVPWSTAEHQIRAIPAEGEAATSLDIAKGTACLVIERRTWSNLGPITHVRLTYPGDRHTLVARFTPSS